jgi:hypothetical protein
MPNLIEQTPEAQDFIATASADVNHYKRFPEENFVEVHAGVLATSAVDLQNERLSVEALEDMATHINTHSLWMMVEHNPLIPPIGRVLVAKRFYAKEGDLYFLVGVMATYDPNSYRTFSDLGIDLKLDNEAVVSVPESERAASAKISFNPHEIPSSVIAEMYEHAPVFVDQEPTLTFRKSAEPRAILEIAASLWLLCQNPFLKKFLERYGEKSADASLTFLSWLKTEVFPRLTQSARNPLFILHFEHKDCRVEFIVPSNDVNVLAGNAR